MIHNEEQIIEIINWGREETEKGKGGYLLTAAPKRIKKNCQ